MMGVIHLHTNANQERGKTGPQIHNYITLYPNSFNLVNNSTNLWGNYLKQTRLASEKQPVQNGQNTSNSGVGR